MKIRTLSETTSSTKPIVGIRFTRLSVTEIINHQKTTETLKSSHSNYIFHDE